MYTEEQRTKVLMKNYCKVHSNELKFTLHVWESIEWCYNKHMVSYREIGTTDTWYIFDKDVKVTQWQRVVFSANCTGRQPTGTI